MAQLNRIVFLSLLGILVSSQIGCQSIQLENHTLRQAKTLTDLQYKMVLDNLAMIDQNPAALPYFSAAGTGLTNIQQSANANFSPSVDLLLNPAKIYRYYSDKFGYGGTATQTNLEQWTTASILNPDELDLMRCAYRKTLGCSSPDCDQKLQAYFLPRHPDELAAMSPGWLSIGGKRELPPKKAAYVGCYRGHIVWVMPDKVEPLTRLTLAILDIATALPANATTTRIDPNAAVTASNATKLKDLQDRATALAAIYEKYPTKTTPLGDELKNQLDAVLIAIIALQTGASPEAVANRLNTRIPHRKAERSLPDAAEQALTLRQVKNHQFLIGEAQAQYNTAFVPEPQLPDEPLFRPRKNLYNPTVIPIGSGSP